MATTVYEREDGQRCSLVLNFFAVVSFASDPMMTMVSAFVLSDMSTLKELVAPTTDLLARHPPPGLSLRRVPWTELLHNRHDASGGISATKHSSLTRGVFCWDGRYVTPDPVIVFVTGMRSRVRCTAGEAPKRHLAVS